MKIIDTKDHPHNLDKTACLIWCEVSTQRAIYRVAAGYVVTFPPGRCIDETFSTQDEAYAAVARLP